MKVEIDLFMSKKDDLNNRRLPDFIHIGTQRSGTTWLYELLKKHPQIWLPPIKEIHFFDRYHKKDVGAWLFQFKNDYRRIRDITSKGHPRDQLLNFAWVINYIFRRRNLSWYSSIFEPGRNCITGEITPSYIALDKATVQNIYDFNPNLKIIINLRDPIDRTWSAILLKFYKSKNGTKELPLQKKLLKYINNPKTKLRSDYFKAIEIWESIFPAHQIQVIFFDDIAKQPEIELSLILKFLGAEENCGYPISDIREKRNSTTKYMPDIPPMIEYEIAKLHLDDLLKLSARFGGHTTKWLDKAQNVIEEYEKSLGKGKE